MESFLNTYSGWVMDDSHSQQQQPKQQKKTSKKKKQKLKPFTAHDFAMEVCSIAELIPFVLPSPDSFATFLNEQALKPFLSAAPGLISEIAEFFEIDTTDDEEDDDNYIADTKNEEAINDTDTTFSYSSEHESRWSRSMKPISIDSTPVAKREPTEEKSALESEESILFQNKVDLSVKTKRRNPLLADSKGRYVGRQFSNNYFREVKVMKTLPVKKETSVGKPAQSHKSTLNSKSNVSRTTSTDSRQKKPRAIGLGASSSSFRNSQPSRDSIINRPGAPSRTTSNQVMSPRKRHPHADVMKALAAMRKKR